MLGEWLQKSSRAPNAEDGADWLAELLPFPLLDA